MKKKLILVALMLLIGLFVGINSANAQTDIEDSAVQFSENAAQSIMGSEATIELMEGLEKYNINVTEDSIIEVIPIIANRNRDTEEDNGTAIVVTNIDDDEVSKDILIAIDEDSRPLNQSIVIDDKTNSMAKGFTYPFPFGSVVITATANYTMHIHEFTRYYRPLNVSFFYTKNKQCSASYIGVRYDCQGMMYYYPGFVETQVQEGWSISSSRSNPIEGTPYTTINEYPSNKVLYALVGLGSGNSITFDFNIDGTSAGYTIYFD